MMNALPTSQQRIRVLVADDHPLIRKLVAATFLMHAHMDVVGEAKDGAEAVELAKQTKPDVVVLNITMPKLNGFQAAREIKKQVPAAAIVILSTHADERFIEEPRSWECEFISLRRKRARH